MILRDISLQGRGFLLSIPFILASPASANNSVSYTYDIVGRLTTAAYDNGMCISYSYDANGNRTSQTNSTASTDLVWGQSLWGCSKWTAP